MAFAYTIRNQDGVHFVTFTVHQWVDVFTRQQYVDILIESLQFCQKNKGLRIYAWVIMSNHCHLILGSAEKPLSDIVRDLKRHTANAIVDAIVNNGKESRKNWMLWLFKKEYGICFWEEGYHGEEIFSEEFFQVKLDYIHLNPLKAGIVDKPEEYINSSGGDFYGTRKGRLELAEF